MTKRRESMLVLRIDVNALTHSLTHSRTHALTLTLPHSTLTHSPHSTFYFGICSFGREYATAEKNQSTESTDSTMRFSFAQGSVAGLSGAVRLWRGAARAAFVCLLRL